MNSEIVVGLEIAGYGNQYLGEVAIYAPVARLICIG
jgi:hypothetical protein